MFTVFGVFSVLQFFFLHFQKNEKGQWIQFNFDKESIISAVRTFGDKKESYVKKYTIEFSEDGTTWIDYKQHGVKRVRIMLLENENIFQIKYLTKQKFVSIWHAFFFKLRHILFTLAYINIENTSVSQSKNKLMGMVLLLQLRVVITNGYINLFALEILLIAVRLRSQLG